MNQIYITRQFIIPIQHQHASIIRKTYKKLQKKT